jgi:hypothetical protein
MTLIERVWARSSDTPKDLFGRARLLHGQEKEGFIAVSQGRDFHKQGWATVHWGTCPVTSPDQFLNKCESDSGHLTVLSGRVSEPSTSSKHLHPFAASSDDDLACNPTGIITGKKRRRWSIVVRLSNSSERSFPLLPFATRSFIETRSAKAFRLDHAGVQRIHADLARTKLL